MAMSPANATRFMRAVTEMDVSASAPEGSCPTLVRTRPGTRVPFEERPPDRGLISGARFVPVESRNHVLLEHEPAWPALARGGARGSCRTGAAGGGVLGLTAREARAGGADRARTWTTPRLPRASV